MKQHPKIKVHEGMLSSILLVIFNFVLFVSFGNVPCHEWTLSIDQSIKTVNDKGETQINIPENSTTWIFEDGSLIPMAKMQGENSYSIITDHLGTPTEAYDNDGKRVWSRQLARSLKRQINNERDSSKNKQRIRRNNKKI